MGRRSLQRLRNQPDDHVKNFSFHMDRQGRWSLTPEYDLTYAQGSRWTAAHQMRVAGKREGILRGNLLHVAERFGLKGATEMLERVEDAVGRRPEYAAECRVPEEDKRRIQAASGARRQGMKARS